MGRLLGGLLGFFILGPIGGLLGYFVGKKFDEGFVKFQFSDAFSRSFFEPFYAKEAFCRVFFQLLGYVAKADGTVSEKELRVARKWMNQFGLNLDQKKQAMHAFEEGKRPSFFAEAALDKWIELGGGRRDLAHLLAESLLEMSYADAGYRVLQGFLEYVRRRLRISQSYFKVIEQKILFENHFQKGAEYQRGSEQRFYQENFYSKGQGTPQGKLDEAYQLLGVSSSVSQIELKQAYRRFIKNYHPDKMYAKGATPEMVAKATKNFQQIQEAYVTIQKDREMQQWK